MIGPQLIERKGIKGIKCAWNLKCDSVREGGLLFVGSVRSHGSLRSHGFHGSLFFPRDP